MAQRGLNEVNLMGNLGQDAEIKVFNEDSSVITLTIATSDVWKDKATGEQKEKTEWHRVQVFGKNQEKLKELLVKGTKVMVRGARLQNRKWQDQEGKDRYSLEIVLNQGMDGFLQIVSFAPNGQGGQAQAPAQQQAQAPAPQQQAPAPQPQAPIGGGEEDDDIPF